RILMQILLNVKKEDSIQSISAVRILGMNRRGQSYLKQLKTKFPERQFITNINKTSAHFFKNEIKATDIYNLLSGQKKDDFNTPVIRLN
ncbi:nucleotidyltransferase family protein, partial [Staphylococcus epidermidis]